jgi:hypothetical protein
MKIKVTDPGKVIATIIVLILWICGIFDWKMFLLFGLTTITMRPKNQ